MLSEREIIVCNTPGNEHNNTVTNSDGSFVTIMHRPM